MKTEDMCKFLRGRATAESEDMARHGTTIPPEEVFVWKVAERLELLEYENRRLRHYSGLHSSSCGRVI